MREIVCGCMIIITNLPINTLLGLQITQEENSHGSLVMQVYLEEEYDVFKDYRERQIKLYHGEPGNQVLLFDGIIETVSNSKEGELVVAEIFCMSKTIELDRYKNNRTFQDPEATFDTIIQRVIRGSKGNYIGDGSEESLTGAPIIQYQETDWQFLVRLASYMNTVLYPEIATGRIDFYVGLRGGIERTFVNSGILEFGLSDRYYTSGGYEVGHDKYEYAYLKIKNHEDWHIGDFLWYQGQRYRIYKKVVCYAEGIVTWFYELGTKRMTYQKKQHHKQLAGVRLEGRICQVEKESIKLQFDIDLEDGADFWWPWTPEVGNLCYLMPELNTKAVLYFPTVDEKDGIAIHCMRENGYFTEYVSGRELKTNAGKRLGLYSSVIWLNGEGNYIRLLDLSGIVIGSIANVKINAVDSVIINGKKIFLDAPLEVICKTPQSNIEISKNINFYGLMGVSRKGTGGNECINEEEDKNERNVNKVVNKVEFRQASYSALATIPMIDLTKSNIDWVINLLAVGSVPKISNGKTILAMKEIMDGKKSNEAVFAESLDDMDIYTFTGGYPLPR